MNRVDFQQKQTGFFISVIKDRSEQARRYSDFVKAFLHIACEEKSTESTDGVSLEINRHDDRKCGNVVQSIFESINKADFFVALIDYVDKFSKNKNSKINVSMKFEPNVWFEIGVAATTDMPMFLIAYEKTEIPFDVKQIETIKIKNELLERMMSDSRLSIVSGYNEVHDIVHKWIYEEKYRLAIEFRDELNLQLAYIIEKPFSPFQALYEHSVLHRKTGFTAFSQLLDDIRKKDAEFISGEDAAFSTLTECIKNTRLSLCTTRFADQSIINSQSEFSNTLFEKSKEISVSERIICNNSPEKWRDIFLALVKGGNIKVYVRSAAFNTHFELVIIDKCSAFIHFYDKSIDANGTTISKPYQGEINKTGKSIQRINSTLRLNGESVCEKLHGIFKRLHHKSSHLFSHTILGVDDNTESETSEYGGKIGVFQLEQNTCELASDGPRLLEAFEIIVNTYKANIGELNSGNRKQNFTAFDAWNMYLGIQLLAKDYGWNPDIEKPKTELPSELKDYQQITTHNR